MWRKENLATREADQFRDNQKSEMMVFRSFQPYFIIGDLFRGLVS